MDRKSRTYRTDRGGINRAVAILLVLIGIMLVIIAIPSWNAYRYRAQKLACEQAMKSAKDGLIIEYLDRWDSGTVQQAMETLDKVLPERANICPAGGTVYLVRRDDGIFEPVCGMHDSDLPRRCRLNAARAMELLGEARRIIKRETKQEPESVRIELNGKPLDCVRVQEEPKLRRGTRTTAGFDGVVAFYGVAGEGAFAAGSGAKNGAVCYFIYADEDYCAIWHANDGWRGTSYDGWIGDADRSKNMY